MNALAVQVSPCHHYVSSNTQYIHSRSRIRDFLVFVIGQLYPSTMASMKIKRDWVGGNER